MGNTKKLSDLINSDGGAKIYEFCGVDTRETRRLQLSPINEERTPSFQLTYKNGVYLHKCFSSSMGGAAAGENSILIHTGRARNIEEARDLIRKIYLGASANDGFTPARNKKQPEPKQEKSTLKSITFHDGFSDAEIRFWADKLSIADPLPVLTANKIRSVKHCAFGKAEIYGNCRFVFAYEAIPNRFYKLYLPKQQYRPSWLTSKTIYTGSQPEGYKYTFGEDTCDLTRPFILTGGETDCLALKAHGYNACTVGGEGLAIPERLRGGTPIYDTDWAGLNGMYKSGLEYKILPKLDRQEIKSFRGVNKTYKNIITDAPTQPKPEANDICDYLRLYGNDFELRSLITGSDVYATVNRFLSQTANLSGLSAKLSGQNGRVIIDLATGSGKSTYICTDFRDYVDQHHPDKVIVFLQPLTAIVDDLGSKYEDKFQIVCAGRMNAAQASSEAHTIITYSSFERLAHNLDPKRVILVIDEIHELLNSSSYTDVGAFILKFSEKCHAAFGMSATARPYHRAFTNLGFSFLKIEVQDMPRVSCDVKIIPQSEVMNRIVEAVKPGEKTLVFHNNKTPGSKNNVQNISKTLKKHGVKSDWFAAVRETKKHSATYRHIVETNKLPDGVDALVSTAVIATGVSLTCDHIVFVAGRKGRDINYFKQAYARNRSKNIRVTVLVVEDDMQPTEMNWFDDVVYEYRKNQLHWVAEAYNAATAARDAAVAAGELPENIKEQLRNEPIQPIVSEKSMSRFIHQYEGRYYPNMLKFSATLYRMCVQRTTVDEFVEQIRREIQNVSVSYEECPEKLGADELHIDAVNEHRDLLDLDARTLSEAFARDKDEVLAYVAKHSESTSVKTSQYVFTKRTEEFVSEPKAEVQSRVDEQLEALSEVVISAKAKKKQEKHDKLVSDLKRRKAELEQYKDEPLKKVIDRNFERLETAIVRIKSLKRIFPIGNMLILALLDRKDWERFYDRLCTLLMLTFDDLGGGIASVLSVYHDKYKTSVQVTRADRRIVERVRAEVPFGQRVAKEALQTIVRQCYNEQDFLLGSFLTPQAMNKKLHALFDITESTDRTQFTVNAEATLESLFVEYGVDVNEAEALVFGLLKMQKTLNNKYGNKRL